MNAFSRFSRVKTRWRRKKRKRRRGDLSVIKNGRALEKRAALLHKKKSSPQHSKKKIRALFMFSVPTVSHSYVCLYTPYIKVFEGSCLPHQLRQSILQYVCIFIVVFTVSFTRYSSTLYAKDAFRSLGLEKIKNVLRHSMEILKMLFKSQTRFCFRFNNSKHIPPNENNKQVVESIYVHSIHTWLIIVLVKFFFFWWRR